MDHRGQLAEVLEFLRTAPRVRAADWPGILGDTLSRPGLYAILVDPEGARDLTRGIGSPISPGVIYAGQSGAGYSEGTLGCRIQNHFEKTARTSTLRGSLAATLVNAIPLTMRR